MFKVGCQKQKIIFIMYLVAYRSQTIRCRANNIYKPHSSTKTLVQVRSESKPSILAAIRYSIWRYQGKRYTKFGSICRKKYIK